MGNRLTQRIYICDVCEEIPQDGEYMWFMSNEVWGEKCCLQDEEDTQPFNQSEAKSHNEYLTID